MSSIRLLIDEDSMDHRFVRALRSRGVDVTTIGELQANSFSDDAQLLLATQHQRALYTFNVGDFCHLHGTYMTEGRTHAGIIISLQGYSIGEQMRRVLKLMATKSAAEMVSQLVFLSAYAGEN